MPEVIPLRPDDPRRVGRYRLSARLSAAAAVDDPPDVFLGRPMDGESVLITRLRADWAADPAARDRLVAEARAARRIAPFCAARVLDVDFEGVAPFLVTEHIPGPTLAEVVDGRGPLPPEAVTAVAVGAATGLAAIHQTGLVHGEFGPGSLVLSDDGPRVTHVGVTPPYGAATPAADLLAWASTVLFAAHGGVPADPAAGLARLPEEVRATVERCLVADPAARPTARAALTELLGGQDRRAGLLAEGARRAEAAARPDGSAPAVRGGPGRGARSQGSGGPGGGRARGPQTRRGRDPRRDGGREPRRDGGARRKAYWWVAAGLSAAAAAAAVSLALAGPRRPPAAAGRPTSRAAALPAAPARFVGSWSGLVSQTNPALSVTVRLTLGAGTAGGAISYPALGCSGHLTLAAAAPSRLTVRQRITVGRRDCEDGVITLVPAPHGSIRFSFSRANGASPAGVLAPAGR